jgi:predicted Zn-dependent peptidase
MHHSGRGRTGGWRGRTLLVVTLAALTLLGACSSDDGGGEASGSSTSTDHPTTSTTVPPPFEHYTLANGLDVVLYPVADATETVLLVTYDIGERHDPPGQSGLAHVTEQVYSTAATGLVPPRAAFEYASLYPGKWWSETGDDFSVMARQFPNDALDGQITEAAARMLLLNVTQDDLDRERERVLLDIDTGLAADPALAARTRAEELIQPSANGGNQSGIPAQVAQLELAAVTERLATLYQPANATLVVVGGFDEEAARATIEQFFGAVPAGQAAGEGAPWGLAGFGEVASVIVTPRGDGEPGVSTASVGYLAPAPDDPTYPAFLAHVARLRASAPAADMTIGYAPLRTPGVITVSTPLAEGETEEAVVERIRAWVALEMAIPLDDDSRALVADDLAITFGVGDYPDSQQRDDPFNVALSLARTGQLGIDPEALAQAVADLDDDDLATSAQATFVPDRSAAAVVLVEPA